MAVEVQAVELLDKIEKLTGPRGDTISSEWFFHEVSKLVEEWQRIKKKAANTPME